MEQNENENGSSATEPTDASETHPDFEESEPAPPLEESEFLLMWFRVVQLVLQVYRSIVGFISDHPYITLLLLFLPAFFSEPERKSRNLYDRLENYVKGIPDWTLLPQILSDAPGSDGRQVIHVSSSPSELERIYENGAFPLHLAAQRGNTDLLSKFLAITTEPNQKGVNWQTPLHVAVKYSHIDAVRLLLASGADPNRRATTYYPATPALLTPLHYAILYTNTTEIAETLLDARANPYASPSAFRFACKEGRPDIANLILDKIPPPLPFPKGADRDALMFSITAAFGWTDSAAQLGLLRRVLDLDSSLIDTLDIWGAEDDILVPLASSTVLEQVNASKKGRAKVAPIHTLVLPKNGTAEALRLLLHHADVNCVTSQGDNALHVLAKQKVANLEAAKVLIDAGINVFTRDSKRRTVLDSAVDPALKALIAEAAAQKA